MKLIDKRSYFYLNILDFNLNKCRSNIVATKRSNLYIWLPLKDSNLMVTIEGSHHDLEAAIRNIKLNQLEYIEKQL